MENELVVRNLYAALGSGDLDAGFSLMNVDVEWLMQDSDLPTMQSSLGRDAVRRWYKEITALIEVTALHRVDFISDGPHVVVYGNATRRGLTTGMEETSEFLQWYTLEGGCLVRSQAFMDTLSHAPVLLAEAAAQGRPVSGSGCSDHEISHSTREKLSAVAESTGSLPRGNAEDSQTLIRRWYSYHSRGELDKALALLDEQVETFHTGSPGLPWAGCCHGRDEVRGAIQGALSGLTMTLTPPVLTLVRDQHVVTFGQRRITHSPSGRTAEFDWATVFEVQAGLIRRMRHYTDTYAFACVLGLGDSEQPDSIRQSPAEDEAGGVKVRPA